MCEPATLTAIASYFGGTAAVGTAAGAAAATAAGATTAAALTTAEMVSLGLTAASAATGAYGAYAQSQTAKKVAQNNANVADAHAKDALARGEKARIEAHQRGSILEGQQRTAMSARGLDLNEGTPSNILGQTDFFTQTDEATARTNGRREAWNAQAQRAGYDAEARGANPGLALAGTLLGSGAKVADKWYSYTRG